MKYFQPQILKGCSVILPSLSVVAKYLYVFVRIDGGNCNRHSFILCL